MNFFGSVLIGLLFPVFALSAAGRSTVDLAYNLKVHTLNDNTYVVIDQDFYDSSILVTMMADGTAVIVSSPFEKMATQSLMKWINQTLKPKKMVAINPHFHLDGTGGNETYKRMGVETWSSDLTKKLRLAENKRDRKESAEFYKDENLKKRILASHPIAAEHTFELEKGKTFQFGGEKVIVFFPGPAHSKDNSVVYFPNRKLLFGGCMIKPETLGNLSDADVKSWANSAEKLKKFDVNIVVPGHTRWGGPELIDKTIAVAKKAAANQ